MWLAEKRLDQAPVPHDADAIANLEHVLKVMCNEEKGRAGVPQSPDQLQQAVPLHRPEHRGRLVKNEQPGFEMDGLGDLDQLLLRRDKRPDRGLEIDRDPKLVDDGLAGLLLRLRAQQVQRATSFGAKADVLANREIRRKGQLLKHHPDCVTPGVFHGAQMNLLAVHQDRPGIRLKDSSGSAAWGT